MKLPIAQMTLPAELRGVKNGQLPPELLVPCGLPGNFKMTPRAAAALKALIGAAVQAGFDVRATGTYRSYAQQERLFLSRYTTEELAGRPTKTWNGVKYWQKPNTAMAATPGSSNHGLGLAVDFAEERDGDPGVESVSTRFVEWLCANAARFGYSAEHQSEPWHWRYVAGDRVPAEVEAFHAGSTHVAGPAPVTPPPPPPAPAASTLPVLGLNARGDAVKELQRRLTAAGFPIAADGWFGPVTDKVVRAFQRSRKLLADGVVGPVTWRALGA